MTHHSTDSEPLDRGRRLGWALVAGQGGLLAGQARMPRGTDWPVPRPLRRLAALAQLGGLAVVVVAARGLGPALTPLPLPRQNAGLREDGLFRHVRHPIYSGALLASCARAAASGNRRQIAASALLIGLLNYKARFEEAALRDRYPEYQTYAATTPRFVPRLRSLGQGKRTQS